MRKFKINSGASVMPSKFENPVDAEFLNDVKNIITLEDGTSLDLNRARLLYNPHTHQVQLTDAEANPRDFVQLATLTITKDKPEVNNDESFEESTEEGAEEAFGEGAGEAVERDTGDIEEEMPADGEDSGEFFQ